MRHKIMCHTTCKNSKFTTQKLLIVSALCLVFLQGCGGRNVEYIHGCDEIGKTVRFTEQMAYLSGFKKHEINPLTYEIGRDVDVLIYDDGKRNNLEQFGVDVTPTDHKRFKIVACYNVVNYGYVNIFAGPGGYKMYMFKSEDGTLSTTIASLVEDKHWKITGDNKGEGGAMK